MKSLYKHVGLLVLLAAALGPMTIQTQAANPTLLAYWDFNTASDPLNTLDKIYAFRGQVESATFTADSGGHSSLAGDRAMDFGGANQNVRVNTGIFLNAAAVDDKITIAFWQKLTDVANQSAFWAVSPSSNNGERGIQAHTPWSNNHIYYDSVGCCDPPQRLEGDVTIPYPTFDWTIWHHFAFVKDGKSKSIWIDGVVFLKDDLVAAPLPTDFTRIHIGSDNATGNSLHGAEDDFAVFAGALSGTSIAALAAGTAPDKLPGVTIPTGPLIGGALGTPSGFTLDMQETVANPIVPSTLVLVLDGASVTPASVIKAGQVTTVTYNLPANTYFPSGSAHTLNVSVKDTSGATTTAVRPFRTVDYKHIPATAKVTPDTSKPGFIWNVTQNTALQANDPQRPEDQLAGLLIDPSTGAPYDNTADPSFQGVALAPGAAPNPTWAPIKFEIPSVINVSQVAGTSAGHFVPDEEMPGIPSDLNGIAAEIVTYIELPAGLTTMGVNSDDGFRTKSGQPLDVFQGIQLGEFSTGRGFADTIFYFIADEAGVYPFRTVWEEGGGDANIEWFTAKADGSFVLVNDTANGGLKAYRASTTPLKPYFSSVSPGPAPRQLDGVSSSVSAILVDGTTEQVVDASVVMKLDGKTVTTTKQRNGNKLTVTYTPDGLLIPFETHTGELSFNGTAGTSRTEQFPLRNLKNIILPNPKILETFDTYPEDTQPTGWVATNFTAHCDDGRDITAQRSESYEDWVLVDVSHVGLIDESSLFNIPPGQFVTIGGTRVELMNADPPGGVFPQWLMSGNVLYAESDSRCNADTRGATDFPNNGQTQFIVSKPFDLSAFQGVVMTFNSIYEQNQDSLGAVEYSVDGGATWLPVMYFLEEPDIKLHADGTVDAVRTFNDANTDTSSWVVNGVKKGGKYGDGIAAPITDALGPYVVPRINDGKTDGQRMEVFRLDQAKGKSDVRLRFASLGTDSWYFAIDNLAFYDVASTVSTAPALSISHTATSVTITFEGNLQQRDSLSTGAWSPAGSTSPVTINNPTGIKYYRAVNP